MTWWSTSGPGRSVSLAVILLPYERFPCQSKTVLSEWRGLDFSIYPNLMKSSRQGYIHAVTSSWKRNQQLKGKNRKRKKKHTTKWQLHVSNVKQTFKLAESWFSFDSMTALSLSWYEANSMPRLDLTFAHSDMPKLLKSVRFWGKAECCHTQNPTDI